MLTLQYIYQVHSRNVIVESCDDDCIIYIYMCVLLIIKHNLA